MRFLRARLVAWLIAALVVVSPAIGLTPGQNAVLFGAGFIPAPLDIPGITATPLAFYSVARCGKASYSGHAFAAVNNSVTASASLETMVDCVKGQLVLSTGSPSNCVTIGTTTCAAFASVCTTTCYVYILYDSSGNANTATLTGLNNLPPLLTNCTASDGNTRNCITFTAANLAIYLAVVSVQALPISMYEFAYVNGTQTTNPIIGGILGNTTPPYDGTWIQTNYSAGTWTPQCDYWGNTVSATANAAGSTGYGTQFKTYGCVTGTVGAGSPYQTMYLGAVGTGPGSSPGAYSVTNTGPTKLSVGGVILTGVASETFNFSEAAFYNTAPLTSANMAAICLNERAFYGTGGPC